MAILKRIKPPPPIPPPLPKPEPPKPVIKPEPPKPAVAAVHPKVVEHRQLGVQNRDAVERVAATRPPETTPPVVAAPRQQQQQQSQIVQAAVFRPQGQTPTIAPAVSEQQQQTTLARTFFNSSPVNASLNTFLRPTAPVQGPGLPASVQPVISNQQTVPGRPAIPTQPGTPPLSPEADAQARQAAAQVQQAYDANPNVVISAPGQGRAPNQPLAQEAAARTLRDVTATQLPEVAAQTVRYAQPTIDRITTELSKTAQTSDSVYSIPQPAFDNVVNDLAATANRAALAPGGTQAVNQIAQSIVRNIDPERIGRFDEALGKSVESGAGSELTVAVAKELQTTGRVAQSDAVLEGAATGLGNLQSRAADVSDRLGKMNEDLSWQISQWKPLMSEQQLAGAVQAFKDQPEYKRAVSENDQIALATLSAVENFGSVERDFNNSDGAAAVGGALHDLVGAKETMQVLAQSPAAAAKIGQLMMQPEDPEKPNFFNQVASVIGKADDLKFFGETTLNLTLGAAVELTVNTAGEPSSPARNARLGNIVNLLEGSATRLGYGGQEFTAVVEQLRTIQTNSGSAEQVRANLDELNTRITAFQNNQPGVFGDPSQLSRKFQSLGKVLSVAGLASSGVQMANDPNVMNALGLGADAGGVAADIAMQRKFYSNLLEGQPWQTNLAKGIEIAGKGFGLASLVLDGWALGDSLRKGENVDAGLTGASMVGGALMMFGGAAATGVGAVLIGAALVGKLAYDHVQEANKHETWGAHVFLQGAGIRDDVADQLLNNDDYGRSAAPVLTALAQSRGVNPPDYFRYLSTLSPDRAKTLIETAHGVDPDSNGVYPVDKQNPYIGGRAGARRINTPNDLNDLARWMRDNGYTAPGL